MRSRTRAASREHGGESVAPEASHIGAVRELGGGLSVRCVAVPLALHALHALGWSTTLHRQPRLQDVAGVHIWIRRHTTPGSTVVVRTWLAPGRAVWGELRKATGTLKAARPAAQHSTPQLNCAAHCDAVSCLLSWPGESRARLHTATRVRLEACSQLPNRNLQPATRILAPAEHKIPVQRGTHSLPRRIFSLLAPVVPLPNPSRIFPYCSPGTKTGPFRATPR